MEGYVGVPRRLVRDVAVNSIMLGVITGGLSILLFTIFYKNTFDVLFGIVGLISSFVNFKEAFNLIKTLGQENV